ncbi:unnamed protein product [Merluccius merluccius]
MGPDRPRSDMPAAKRFKHKKPLTVFLIVTTMVYTVQRQLPDRPALTPPPYRHPPYLCPQADPGTEKVPLVDVNGKHTLLISAYLDRRKTIREVRIIAVALRSEQAAYRCHLCCQGQRHNTTGNAYVHKDHFGFDYGTMDIFCLLPAECPDPSHVAVSVVGAPAEKELRYLEVQNREPISDDFPHDFTICISTMFDFSNVLQLIQSMEMLRLLGVTKVVVYKTSCNAHTQKVLDYYESTGFMDVIAWPLSSRLNVSRGWQPADSPGQLHYFGQIAALNDCMYRYMYLSRYIGLHDIDEIIIPQKVDSWKDLMPLLEQAHGVDRGYMFENFVFPTSISWAPPTQASHLGKGWPQVEGVNILHHLYYEPLDTQSFHNFKILVNPRAVRITSVHGLLDSAHGCEQVPNNVARMYHTRDPITTGLKPEELTFDGHLLDYRDRLVPAVNAVLEKSELL